MAYDGDDLEIMTTERVHEYFKERLGQIVATVARVVGVPRRKLGETTWKRPELARGIEADQCYCFDVAKLIADKLALARKSNNVADYPDPDQAVEIDISGPKFDRSGIYALLRVPEVWRFDGTSIVIEQLQEVGTYAASPASVFLPLSADQIRRWLIDEDHGDELDWERRLDSWAESLRPQASVW